jgi:hypothetical protein
MLYISSLVWSIRNETPGEVTDVEYFADVLIGLHEC